MIDTKAIEAELAEFVRRPTEPCVGFGCKAATHIRNLLARVKELEAELEDAREQYGSEIEDA